MGDKELSKHIARRIFEVGGEPGRDCHRIAFMVGGYENEDDSNLNKSMAGGFMEEPLVRFIEKVLNET